ncbi:Extra-large guanine nucleotide-binding protein 1 [Linum grandiflorum]
MAEGLKSRLACCPNCRNLLTEFNQCSSCSAVLRAKKKALNKGESDGDSSDKLGSLLENEERNSMNPSETHRENCRDKSKTLLSREKDRVLRGRASDVMINRRRMIIKENQKGFQSSWEHNGFSSTGRPYGRPLKNQHVDELVHRRGVDNRMMSGDGYGRIRRDHDPVDGATTRRIANLEHVDELVHRRGVDNRMMSGDGYGRIRRDHDPVDGATTRRIANLEHDRAELLRKVDVLSQQLNNTRGRYPAPGSDHVCESSRLEQYGHMHQMERFPLHNKVMIPPPFPRSQQQRFESQPAASSCSISPSRGYNTRGNGYGFDPRRKVAAQRNRRLCRPIAYGAPFIVCCACFELLKLPEKIVMQKLKLRCGSCSVVLMLEFQSKKLMVSVCEETTESHVKIVDGSCDVVNEVRENGEDSGDLGHFEVQSTTLSESNPAEERESKKKNEDHASSSSSSSCSLSVSSEEEETVPQEVSFATVEDNESPSMRTLQYQENPIDYGEPISLQRKGDRITHTRDQANDSRISSRQSSRKLDASYSSAVVADAREEDEFSFNDYVNMDSSVDSIDTSKSKVPAPIQRWIETSLAGVFKKSLRDLAKPPQQANPYSTTNNKANVFVNGQPIHEQTLRLAEKLAGPIHPGDYWYDFRAGFWGVMGQPCLGVIPPFIEEFNYPMPRNCAAGNTGVFVNGRELHQQDLELLCKRGLPNLEHKFYTLEIDGRLYDNDTGKELHGIGKLAPTVEKVKRGFGMRVPSESVVESE